MSDQDLKASMCAKAEKNGAASKRGLISKLISDLKPSRLAARAGKVVSRRGSSSSMRNADLDDRREEILRLLVVLNDEASPKMQTNLMHLRNALHVNSAQLDQRISNLVQERDAAASAVASFIKYQYGLLYKVMDEARNAKSKRAMDFLKSLEDQIRTNLNSIQLRLSPYAYLFNKND